jgi:hypothetical protein
MNQNQAPPQSGAGFGSDGIEPGAAATGHVEGGNTAPVVRRPGFGGRPGADYRDLDYRSLDYRAMDYRGADYRGANPEGEGEVVGIDWAAALWRYRYALVIPVLAGMALAAAFFMTRPNYYRSTARLVVESDRPTVLDANSGEVISGVPPADLLLMQLRSEQVLNHAARHPLMAEAAATMPPEELQAILTAGIVFENALQQTRSDRATAFLLHFDDTDPQFAVNAVASLSDGLQHFFTSRSETSMSELKRLITDIDGDIAGLGQTTLLITPAGMRIDRTKYRARD